MLVQGILTFLNNILRGRKANWLARVKEELLALGVVSLVLLFLEVSDTSPTSYVLQNPRLRCSITRSFPIDCRRNDFSRCHFPATLTQPSLQKICIPLHKTQDAQAVPPSPPPPPVAYGTYSCVYGYRQVFPKTAIHAAHYLLFYLAMVHILFSLLTSVITNIKVGYQGALPINSFPN